MLDIDHAGLRLHDMMSLHSVSGLNFRHGADHDI